MYAVIKGRWLIFPRPIAVLPSPVSIGKVVRLGRQRFVVAGTIVSADKGRLPQHRTFDPQSAYLGAWGKVWLSCNYFLLHILMILHKTDNFHSSPVMADSSDAPCLSAGHGTKNTRSRPVSRSTSCACTSLTRGDVAPPICNFQKRPFSDKNGAKVRKIPETHKETQKKWRIESVEGKQ